jgi:N6-adenosine-specific RNA methylase IME4
MPNNTEIIIGDARQIELTQFSYRYGAMIIDPPWPYDNPVDHNPRWGGYTYDPMTIDEIRGLPIKQLALSDCALYVWATWPKLIEAADTVRAWGAEYITGFPWIKMTKDGVSPVYRRGHWVAGCSEPVLIARFGNVSPPPAPKYLGLVGSAFKHSRKPDDIHQMIEDDKLPGPYLELFARRSRPGWTSFGNEIEDITTGMVLRPANKRLHATAQARLFT